MKSQNKISSAWSIPSLVTVTLIALVLRIVGAFMLHREPFGDAYCYIEQMAAYRSEVVSGKFSINYLYGFWLPLYQFFCSLITLVVNQPVYVGKLVSAVTGAGVCVLVYLCSYVLTSNQKVSLVAALAIALNPFHLQYSSAAMTDVPHALMVISCMYFVMTERWTLAACFGTAAGLIRLDSWMLLVIVPVIQLMRQRKIPVLTILILAIAPAFWLFVCWRATGDWLASFHAHDEYVRARLTAHPEFNTITLDRTWIDANRLAYSANIAVLAGCFVALWFLFREWRKTPRPFAAPLASRQFAVLFSTLSFVFGYFSFISVAYFTKNQSDIWPRYGLILLGLGLPALAYSAQRFAGSPSILAKLALAVTLIAGATQYKTQAEDLWRFASTNDRSQTIASYLKQAYAADPSIKIFCDQTEVRVLSGIPRGQFFDSWFVPKDRAGFIKYLQSKGIKFLVIPQESETSTPGQLYPGLIKETGDLFEAVIPDPEGQRLDSLYRIRVENLPPG
jgi:hypothetical protein